MKFAISFLTAIIICLVEIEAYAQLVPDDLINSFNGKVNAIEIDQQRGIAYIGGEFNTYFPSFNGGDIFSRDTYEPLRNLPWIPYVDQVVEDGEGGWFVASGYIEGIDESSVNNYQIVHVSADGTVEDTPFDYPTQTAGFEIDLMMRFDDFLFVRDGINLDVYNWQTGETIPLQFNGNGNVFDIDIRDGLLYFVGDFTTVNGQERKLACSYDMQTWELTEWSIDINAQFPAFSEFPICYGIEFSDSQTYFLLSRSFWNGTSVSVFSEVVRFDTESWTYNWEVPIYLETADNLRHYGNRFYVVGYDNINGSSYSQIHYWTDPEEPYDTPVPYIETDPVYQLDVYEDKLFITGAFEEWQGEERFGFAVLDALSMALLPEHLPYNGSNGLFAYAKPSTDQIFITTTQGPLGGQRADYFAAIDLSSGELLPWDIEMDAPIVDLLLSASGDTLFMAGAGLINNDISPTHLMAVNPVDQFIISSYFSTPSLNSIDAVGNSLFIQFSSTNVMVNGQSRSRIASFDLSTFQLQPVYFNINGGISCFDLRNDSLLVSGSFTNINSVQRFGAAMLSIEDFSVMPWDPHLDDMEFSSFFNSAGATWMKFYNQSVLAVGVFPPADGFITNSGVCRLTLDAGERLPGDQFPIEGNIVFINSCKLRGDLLYIGGRFSNSSNSKHLSALNLSSGTWENQGVYNSYPLVGINDMELFGDKLISGGDFFDMLGNDDFRNCMTWDMGCFEGQLSIPNTVSHCPDLDWTITAEWQGSEPESYLWEYSNDDGENWMIYDGNQAELLIDDGDFEGSLFQLTGYSSCDTVQTSLAVIESLPQSEIGAGISSAEVCTGSVAVLNAPIPVVWNNGASSGSPFVTGAPGNYQSVATANATGCYAPDTVSWTVLELPQLSYMVLDSLDCTSNIGSVLLTATDGESPYTFLFNNNAINAFVANAQNDVVYAVRDANFCISAAPLQIPYEAICTGCMDQGATNYNPEAVFEGTCEYLYASCEFDLSGDGAINTSDLVILLGDFGCIGNCPADFDQDGIVGVSDLYFIIGYFEFQCE